MTADLAETTPPNSWGPQRSRTVTWHAPGPSTATGMSMAGVDYLQAMIDGKLPPPPIFGLMQFDIVSAEPGRVVFTCLPDESAYSPFGAIHGGLVCTLLDTVAGCAVHSTLPQGKGYTTVEIKVNYLKAVRLSSGLLTATGTVVKSGARVGFAQGVVTDANGALAATASSTLLVFDL
jgi:uncharacterized protein (TIGR00369 family)